MFVTILLILGGLSFTATVIVLSALMLSSRIEHGYETEETKPVRSKTPSYRIDTVPVSRRVDTQPV